MKCSLPGNLVIPCTTKVVAFLNSVQSRLLLSSIDVAGNTNTSKRPPSIQTAERVHHARIRECMNDPAFLTVKLSLIEQKLKVAA